ncbi:diphosphomevalonate decarboxylase (MVD) [Vairimorpha necatrix]|uniref:Diphosphomevalonate decarboxylase n=1 Tax=Vairimorpha necatrix TaxID=6039 RepID=A0AAX4JC96_9MICR
MVTGKKKITVTSNPNIAIIKYWGKENIESNICSNPSISFQCNKLVTTTSLSYNDQEKDEFIFNGKLTTVNKKIEYIVNLFRKIKNDTKSLLIESDNNFPHSCGVASSASGFSALVLALDKFYETNFSEKDLSILARECSGSGSRSIPKNIVMCDKYESYTIGEWKEMKILLIKINEEVKKVSSTEGMCRTQETSFFYKERLNRVDEKIFLCQEYIKTRDHQSLFKLIMRESNEIHAIMFESYPPIRYISDKGYEIMERIHDFNKDEVKMAYTFDAGTNPFIFVLEKDLNEAKEYFKDYEMIECN